jgi:phosphoserine phosphatase RsbU/P
MKILIADDDPLSRLILEGALTRLGYEVIVATSGLEAIEFLRRDETLQLAIIDWMMPGVDGLEVTRQIRATLESQPVYIMLLTSRTETASIVEGLEAGADEYLTKPFDQDELRARVAAGTRIIELQNSLAAQIKELRDALANVKQLQGLLPICSYCKRIRDDRNYWQEVEEYIGSHSESRFTHSICPECLTGIALPEIEQFKERLSKKSEKEE